MILVILDKHDEALGRLDVTTAEWQETGGGIHQNITTLMVPIDRSGMPVAARLYDVGKSASAPLEGLQPVRRGDAICFNPWKMRVAWQA